LCIEQINTSTAEITPRPNDATERRRRRLGLIADRPEQRHIVAPSDGRAGIASSPWMCYPV
jgi:hypothetical protein